MIMKNKKNILIIAHRGASSIAPENTLKAFQKAIDLNADFIEFDVYKSKDGELVIWHDAEISQKDGQMSFIKDLKLEKLKSIDVGEGEKITTLGEIIEIAKGRIGLQCEVKAQNFGKDLIGILKKEDLIETSIISSFIFSELLELQKLDSNLKLGLLLPKEILSSRMVIKFCKKAIDNNFFAIHPYWKAINKEIVDFAHSNNLLVNIWTHIYEPIEDSVLKEVVRMGIDGLIHDDIQQAKRVIREN